MSEFPRIILGVSSTQIYKNTDDNNLNFYNNNLNVISLDSSGNVGIGNTTPNYKLDVNGTGRFTSDLTIDANLIVNGTTITMNASTMEVEDPLISLSSNNSADVTDIGFYGQYNDGTAKYTGLFRDSSDSGEYKLFKGLEIEPTTTINTSGTGYALADFECANINLTGDLSINGIVQSFGDTNIWSEASSIATYDGSIIANGTGSVVFQTKCNGTLGFQFLQINGLSSHYFSVTDPGSSNYMIYTENSVNFGSDIDWVTMLAGRMQIQDLHVQEGTIVLTNTISGGGYDTNGTHLMLETESGVANFNLNNKEASATLFSTNDTERMRIDSSGNVGIGTNSPDDKLHIYENANDSIQLKIENAYASSRAGISIINDSSYLNIQQHSGAAIIENYGTTGTYFYQKGSGGYVFRTTDSNNDRLVIANDGSVGIGDFTPTINLAIGDSDTGFHSMGDGELAWYSNNTRRAYLTSEGNFCIGNRDIRSEVANTGLSEALIFTEANSYAADKYLLTCWQDSNNTHQMGLKFDYYSGSGATSNTHTRIDFVSNAQNDQAINDGGMYTSHRFYSSGYTKFLAYNSAALELYRESSSAGNDILKVKSDYGSVNTTVAVIETNGDYESLSNSYGGISDIRLKENIVDAKSQWNDIKSIQFRKYNFKNQPETKHLGVIAQELELISPGLIKTKEDEMGTKSVKTSIMYMKGMKALQESMLRIENLEDINTESKLKIKNLESDRIKEKMFINNIINNKYKQKVINESTFSRINGTLQPLKKIQDMAFIQYMDNNNNVKQYSEETTPLYYGIGEESLKTYVNIYDKDTNRFLPTIYKKGKLINDEIEIYNHKLNKNEFVLVKFTIENNKYEEEILVTDIIDATHIKIDNTRLQKYFEFINNRNIFIYGTRIKNINILNDKFLYSLSSLSLSGIKELNNKVNTNNENTLELINNEKTENTNQNIKIQSNTENLNNIANKFNTLVQEHMVVKDVVQKSGETINKLLIENNNLKNTINTLNAEKELNTKNIVLLNNNFNKHNSINQNNLNLLNEHIKKQQILINKLMEKMNDTTTIV